MIDITLILPSRRQLEGKEKADIMLLAKLTKPDISFNSQRFSTDRYNICGKTYDFIYGLEEDVVVEEFVGRR